MKLWNKFSQHVSLLAIEIIVGIGVSVGSILIFIKLSTEVLEKELAQLDNGIIAWVYNLRNPRLTEIMKNMTNLGAWPILAMTAVIIVFLVWKKHQKEAVLFLTVLVMGLAINMSLKVLIQRPRPNLAPLIVESSYSYPSGHAMNSFVFYGMIAFYVYRFTRNKRASLVIGTVCAMLVLMIGFSRVYLGVHYPTDVLAGYIAGGAWFVTAILIEKSETWLVRRIYTPLHSG